MAQVQVVTIDTRCRCRQDFIGATFGWLWGPCRHCRILRQRQIIVVPAANGTTQYVTVPQQVVVAAPPRQVQYVTPAKTANNLHQQRTPQQQPKYPSTAPPEYSEKPPIN